MTLEMRRECESCHAPLTREDEAWICVYECTFCRSCVDALARMHPNCGGELVRRPRPGPQSEAAAA